MGDSKGNQTTYSYLKGTNLLTRKLIYEQGSIKKRTFQSYNEDAACIRIIDDDSRSEKEEEIISWGNDNERHIKNIKPKNELPGVGLPEIIEEKALDLKNKQEILIRKLVNVYDSLGNLLSCSTYDANGEYAFSEQRNYNELGKVSSETDAIGKETNYKYDAIGNQKSVFIPKEHHFVGVTYDYKDQPINVTEINLEGTFVTNNVYDILGRKLSTTDYFGNTTEYEYDTFGRLTKITYPKVYDENKEITHPIFSYSYDIFGNVVAIIDPKGHLTEKTYNLRGDVTKVQYPDGSFELFKYDTEGSLHRSLSRSQIITVYEYDYLGRCIFEESSISNERGSASYVKSKKIAYNAFRCINEKEENCFTQYYYDPAGRLTSKVENVDYQKNKDSNCRLLELSYDLLGRMQQKKVWFDFGSGDYSLEFFDYDLLGHVLKKRITNDQGIDLLKRSFSYDAKGNCKEEYNDENGVRTVFLKTSYNSQGEPTSYIDGCGQETKILIDRTYQNVLGQRVVKKTIISPIGVKTEIEFDALNRIHSICKKDPLDLLLSSEKIYYDTLGNKACEIHDRILDGEILESQETRWNYGPMGQLLEKIEAANSPLERKTLYTYNSFGQLISKTMSGEGISINYGYNWDGRVEKIDARNDKEQLIISNRYSYDNRGNITQANTDSGISVRRSYNIFNQVTSEAIYEKLKLLSSMNFVYDRKGSLREVVLPDQSKICYLYDAVFGKMIKRVSPNKELLYKHTYDLYDNQGHLLTETQIGYGGTNQYNLDFNGKILSIENAIFQRQYTWDTLGRLTHVTGESNREEYTYNQLSQLTSEEKGSKKTYTYDSLDNCLKIDNQELVHNALNQLTAFSEAEFSYDQQGNLLRKVFDGEETQFQYNLLSQLTAIKKGDTELNFSFDPFGRLILLKHVDPKNKDKRVLSTSRYIYLGYQEIGSINEKREIETLKVPGINGNELALTSIAIEIKGNVYLPIHDLANNVVCLVDPQNRQVIESYQYTAFGQETIFNHNGEVEEFSPLGNPWRFAEKRVNEDSGLVLFGLRFYDPKMARWINPDPAGFIDGPNLYAYLHNNPINFQDRFGLATEPNTTNKFHEYFYGEVETHCYCERHRNCKRGGDIGKTDNLGLPRITYCDFFEKFYKGLRTDDSTVKDFYNNSYFFDLRSEGLPNLPNGLGIGFIGGILGDYKDILANTRYVSRLAGGYNVHAVYNATHGPLTDLLECKIGLKHVATEPVRQLHKMWNSFFEKGSANAKFLMICHSQGTIHVMNALLDYPPELRKRILVVAIAPGGYVYQKTCADVLHYRAKPSRDLIPRLDRDGVKRAEGTIVDLTSHPSAPLFDHPFTSPTYQEIIQGHIINYIKTQGNKL